MHYEKIMYEHFNNPVNVGIVNDSTHQTIVGNPDSGVVIKITAKINNDIIENIAFKAYGNEVIIASLSLLTQKVKGKSLTKALAITNEELMLELSLDSSKLIYIIMVTQALKNLVTN